jgi:hypothetical protein
VSIKKPTSLKPKKSKEEKSLDMSKTSTGSSNANDSTLSGSSFDMSKSMPRGNIKNEFNVVKNSRQPQDDYQVQKSTSQKKSTKPSASRHGNGGHGQKDDENCSIF